MCLGININRTLRRYVVISVHKILNFQTCSIKWSPQSSSDYRSLYQAQIWHLRANRWLKKGNTTIGFLGRTSSKINVLRWNLCFKYLDMMVRRGELGIYFSHFSPFCAGSGIDTEFRQRDVGFHSAKILPGRLGQILRGSTWGPVLLPAHSTDN